MHLVQLEALRIFYLALSTIFSKTFTFGELLSNAVDLTQIFEAPTVLAYLKRY